MHLDDKETELLKQWTIKKLEDITDADSDVLADYVLALVKTDDPKAAAKPNFVENLKDFLLDNTESFVDSLLQAISAKSFDPNRPLLKPTAPVYQPPRRQSYEQPRLPNESRKRSYQDWDRDEHVNGQAHAYQSGDRPIKQARRGGRGYDHRGGRQSQPPQYQYGLSQHSPLPQMPTPPPGMPQFDPNNPMAALLAMQQMMGLMPGMQNGASPPNGKTFRPPPMDQRCRDYDTKGFCAAGTSCPYEHGNDPYVVQNLNQEYDPNSATLLDVAPTRVGHVNAAPNERGRGGARGRGRGRGGGSFRGGGKRADFSHTGPNRDTSVTSIVVEQIPVERCNEQSVQDFFSEFGTIEEITLQSDKKLAIVKFDSYEAARKAYESPRVVFDNRFVKVYWYKPEKMSGLSKETSNVNHRSDDVDMQEELEIDYDELAKRQEEAQRKHEESRNQREEAEKQREDVGAKLKAMEAERKKMADRIAGKSGKASSPTKESEATEQTKALKTQLAKLEEEAKSLGLDPETATNGHSTYPSYRGRGGYRGRGRGRGRGYAPSFRGGWPGRGGGGAVMRLDNRAKTVAITFSEGSYDNHDEALRQFLLFNSLDSAALTKHPEKDDTALLSFNQRYEGEIFMAAASNSELLHIGKVELAWYKPEGTARETNGTHEPGEKAENAVVIKQTSSDLAEAESYDVADEEDLDRWG